MPRADNPRPINISELSVLDADAYTKFTSDAMAWYKQTYPEEYAEMERKGPEAVDAACRKATFVYLAGKWDREVHA
ncbi:hypothetical protein NMY22_g19354 [Coprinellus aureogranulatus]|nr:hypothetical protein NMY22_g19354 [Coprinellus aureogranulatus]